MNKNKSRMECFWKVQRNLSGLAPSPKSNKIFMQSAVSACLASNDIWMSNVSYKSIVKTLETYQRAMERKMLSVKLKDRICNTIVRQRSRVTDIIQYVTNVKWKWAGYITWMKDNRQKHRVADKGCKISWKTKILLERWHCRAVWINMTDY